MKIGLLKWISSLVILCNKKECTIIVTINYLIMYKYPLGVGQVSQITDVVVKSVVISLSQIEVRFHLRLCAGANYLKYKNSFKIALLINVAAAATAIGG